MFNILLGSGFGVLAGAFVIWRGRSAVKNRFIANSAKSAFVTGVTHFDGEKAVRTGKILIVMGIAMMAISGLIFMGAAGMGLIEMAGDMGRGGGGPRGPGIPADVQQEIDRAQQNGDTVVFDGADARRGGRGGSNAAGGQGNGGPSGRGPGGGGLNDHLFNSPPGNNNQANNQPNNANAQDDEFNDREFDQQVEQQLDESRAMAEQIRDDMENSTAQIREQQAQAMEQHNRNMEERLGGRGPNPPGGRGPNPPGGRGPNPPGSSAGNLAGNNAFGQGSDTGFGAADIDPGTPEMALPLLGFDTKKTIKSNLVGFTLGVREKFDTPPDNGVMVGLIVGEQLDGFREGIINLQAVYQCGDKYVKGDLLGTDGGEKSILLAPAGYVVYGLQAYSGNRIDAIRLGYMRMDDKGRLRRKEMDVSQWVGPIGIREDEIDGEGKAIVGLYIGSSNSSGLAAVGLFAAESTDVLEAASKSRTWTSANGAHAMIGEYVSQTATHVKLKIADGSEMDVEIISLGSDDQTWIEAQK